MCICICGYVCVWIYIHACIYLCTCVCAHECRHMCLHACEYMCTRAHIYTVCLVCPASGAGKPYRPYHAGAQAQEEGAVPLPATRGLPEPSNPGQWAGLVRPRVLPRPPAHQPLGHLWEDSPEEAPEEGHVDEGCEEAEVEERCGVHTAGGEGRSEQASLGGTFPSGRSLPVPAPPASIPEPLDDVSAEQRTSQPLQQVEQRQDACVHIEAPPRWEVGTVRSCPLLHNSSPLYPKCLTRTHQSQGSPLSLPPSHPGLSS